MHAKRSVPDGFHSVTPHLVVANAARAIEFYAKAFGAQERVRIPGPGGSVAHAELVVEGSTIMLADENPEFGSRSPLSLGGTPVTISLYVADADAVFARAVAAGAEPRMPVTEMFWGDRYGQVVDPSGHVWAVSTRVKDLTPAQMMSAAAAMFGGA